MVPFLIVTSVLSNSTAISDPSLIASSELYRYFGLVLANIASISVCWLYLEVVDRTLFKNKGINPIKIYWVLLFGASLGFLKGYTTGLFSWLVGSELDLALAISNRVAQTTLLGLWTLPLVAVVTATFIRFQNERQVLMAETLEQGLNSRNSLLRLEESSVELSLYLSQARTEVSALRNSAKLQASNQRISQKLRDLVDSGLRPISHKIWQENSKASGLLKISQLAKLAVKKNPFPIALIIGGLAMGLFPITLSAFPVGEALARTFIMLTLTSVVLFLAKALPRESRLGTWIIILGASLVSTFVSLAAADAFFDQTFDSVNIATWTSFFLWQLQLSLFSSVVSEVVSSRVQMRQLLIESIGKDQLDSDLRGALGRIRNRELAQYIHGYIQNKLLSFALKFDQENLSTDDVSRLLDEVDDLFSTAISDYQSFSEADLDKQLAQLVSLWSGFVGVELSKGISTADLSNEEIKSIVQVVSEAVSNSVRHGLAKSLKITITKADSASNQVEVVVEDDGLGPRSGRAGLGTELFNATSGTDWSLTGGKMGGSVLRVRITTQSKI
jgi:anti-sigma regulatory factor (Ser/Thr protein kinase)